MTTLAALAGTDTIFVPVTNADALEVFADATNRPVVEVEGRYLVHAVVDFVPAVFWAPVPFGEGEAS